MVVRLLSHTLTGFAMLAALAASAADRFIRLQPQSLLRRRHQHRNCRPLGRRQ